MHPLQTEVSELLNGFEKKILQIVETGSAFTQAIAEWVAKQQYISEFISVDLDFQNQLATHRELEKEGVARYCRFLTQDHIRYLSTRTWVDAIFLDPPDLQSGVTEFLIASSTGAKAIAMSDYQTKSAQAIRRAKDLGWRYVGFRSDFNILRRPD